VPAVVFRSPRAAARLDRARAWLSARGRSEEVLVVAPTFEAAGALCREVARASGASFGWRRTTLGRLAALIAAPLLAERNLAAVGPLPLDALASRVVHALAARGGLGRFAPVADFPGLPRAVARTLLELRMADVGPAKLRGRFTEFVDLHGSYEEELARARLADRALVFRVAIDACSAATLSSAPIEASADAAARRPRTGRGAPAPAQLGFAFALEPATPEPVSPEADVDAASLGGTARALLGRPLLLLDVPICAELERDFVAAIAARSSDVLITVPEGDDRTLGFVDAAIGDARRDDDAAPPGGALSRLQRHLFGDASAPLGDLDDGVTILSAPGESRESAEIARRIQREAERGVPFDRMAILLRAPQAYRSHIEEALRRAKIPAYFARGSVRPDAAGRAFLALLRCKLEKLSARRFAEYLSLGQVPAADAHGEPPKPADDGDRYVPPDAEYVREPEPPREDDEDTRDEAELASTSTDVPVVAGTLRAPRRWEKLLVDASVIGGLDRWRRRLRTLDEELASKRSEARDEALAGMFDRQRADLAALTAFALPLLEDLDRLPDGVTWGEHLDALAALATRALRSPDRVLSVLAELGPMAKVGPVELVDVELVLGRRLSELVTLPGAISAGKVFVAPIEAARGLAFDVVFVPGLAERIFPQKVVEDPILRDDERREVGCLATNKERAHAERLALRVAVGAASERLVLSYPRVDLDQSRPRVPSFYGLEVLRAAEGVLPGFDELARRAERGGGAMRIGWPAPELPEHAIDEAEYDLALLGGILKQPKDATLGAAHYLLAANDHLARALRFRARRWNVGKWNAADGLVAPTDAGALAALAKQGLAARSFSATALQHFAACPYRFLLQAIHKLQPRGVPEQIEELDPLQKGSLVHEVLYELVTELRDVGELPVAASRLDRARERLDGVVKRVVGAYEEKLAPAIPRVWDDGIEAIVADLREWLRRAADDAAWRPTHLELSFGLVEHAEHRDKSSRESAVPLACGIQLRGSIDLVEENAGGELRVTDYKTGKKRADEGMVIAGGKYLQPVLYALALEGMFPEKKILSGRLYYATTTGGFESVDVPLDDVGRDAAQRLADALGHALADGFFPAAPEKDACMWCDMRPVCGPYEELRASRKQIEPLALLKKLREAR
jgi:RecB family exonuclease